MEALAEEEQAVLGSITNMGRPVGSLCPGTCPVVRVLAIGARLKVGLEYSGTSLVSLN